MKSILDPSFRYVNSANTDIRKTFARVRREQRQPASKSNTVVVRLQQLHKISVEVGR